MFQVFKISISFYLLKLLILGNLHLTKFVTLSDSMSSFMQHFEWFCTLKQHHSCLSYDAPFKLDLCFLNLCFDKLLFALTFRRNLLKRRLTGSITSHRIFSQRGRTKENDEKQIQPFICTLLLS